MTSLQAGWRRRDRVQRRFGWGEHSEGHAGASRTVLGRQHESRPALLLAYYAISAGRHSLQPTITPLTSRPHTHRLVMTFCRAAACAAASFWLSRGSGLASRRSASCRVLLRWSMSAFRPALRSERNRGRAKKAAA